jgi:hypothetical protein
VLLEKARMDENGVLWIVTRFEQIIAEENKK